MKPPRTTTHWEDIMSHAKPEIYPRFEILLRRSPIFLSFDQAVKAARSANPARFTLGTWVVVSKGKRRRRMTGRECQAILEAVIADRPNER